MLEVVVLGEVLLGAPVVVGGHLGGLVGAGLGARAPCQGEAEEDEDRHHRHLECNTGGQERSNGESLLKTTV